MQDIMAYVEELTRRAAKRKPEPTSQPDPPMSDREAALTFVNRSGARLVAACSLCYPRLPASAQFAVSVPKCNDSAAFRKALLTLRIPYPIITRHDPLEYLPARCEHVQAGRP